MKQDIATQRHYFIADATAAEKTHTFNSTLFGQDFRFNTCSGLFSYEKPDAASVLLMQVMCNTQPPLQGDLLDLGCGYGLIGIVLGKTHAQAATITQSDINEIACTYAQKNAATNGICTSVVHSDGFVNIAQRFHHITLNPPIHAGKEAVNRLYEASAAHLHPGGALYIVIQKKHGAESTLTFLSKTFREIKILYKRKGYFIAQCIN
ncbi:MAG: methyltransferase [Defluviitaleaceae bacterium]|nr:methyltransferase [Defluviitaleaceae bacterium]